MNHLFKRRPPCGIVRVGLAAGATFVVLATIGCATVPAPTDQVAVSTAAVAQAVAAGAPELAGADMRLARDKLARANTAMAAKDYRQALWLAQEAELDAQVAQAKAQSVKAQRASDAVLDDSRVLRDELERKSK
jgi:hypothetical protein